MFHSVDDVYAASATLEAAGCSFKKKPDEGRMKGLAFVYDPDGYWVELVKRGDNSGIAIPYNFSQTMLRVRNPQKSLEFYRDYLGMQLVRESHYPDAQFSLYFLASSSTTLPDNGDARNLFGPVLELTHNHGTETQADFRHFTGNEDDRKGFGHVGFLVDNVYEACDALRPLGYGFKKVCPVCVRVCWSLYIERERKRENCRVLWVDGAGVCVCVVGPSYLHLLLAGVETRDTRAHACSIYSTTLFIRRVLLRGAHMCHSFS